MAAGSGRPANVRFPQRTFRRSPAAFHSNLNFRFRHCPAALCYDCTSRKRRDNPWRGSIELRAAARTRVKRLLLDQGLPRSMAILLNQAGMA
jgi:hypothetical protein